MAVIPSLAVVAGIQLCLAATFLIIPVVALRFGDAAQEAAEAYAERQGVAGSLLLEHGFKIRESRLDLVFPLALAALFLILAALNLVGSSAGRTGSLVVHAVFFFVGGFITAGQVFVVQYSERAFARSANVSLQRLDVRELVAVANAAFPAWLRPLIVIRFVLATAGSALIVVLLLTAYS